MTLTLLDQAILAGYAVAMLAVGLTWARRASRSTEEFFLTGRSLPWWLAGTSMVATTFAADTPLVVTSYVRSGGIAANWIWFNFAISHLLTTLFLAALWRRAGVTTDVEFIALRYSGRPARILRTFKGAFYAFVTNSVVMGWVILAMATIVVESFGLPPRVEILGLSIPAKAAGVGAGLVVAATYSTLSGLWGVVVTDLLQFAVAMTGSVVLAVSCVRAHGGPAAVAEALRGVTAANGRPATEMAPLGLGGAGFADPGFSAALLGFLVAILVQWWSWKYSDGGGVLIQRMAACRTERDSVLAMLWFTFANYVLRPWPWFLVALVSLLAFPTLEDPNAAYPRMMTTYLGPGWFGLMLAAMLAAFMSTIDTHLNLASSYFVVDLWKPWRGARMSEREGVLVARLSGLVFLALGGVIALLNDSIRGLFELLLRLVAGAGPVFLLRWFWWRINAWAELAAMVSSLAVATFLELANHGAWFGRTFPSAEIFVLNVALSGIVWLTVALRTAPDDAAHREAFVRRVRPPGAWGGAAAAAGGARPALRDRLGLWAAAVGGLYLCLFGVGHLFLLRTGLGLLLTGCGVLVTILVARRVAGPSFASGEPR